MVIKPSKSEDNGIEYIPDDVQKIYSVGISTAGAAEIRMAALNSTVQIIATSIDEEGLEYTRKAINEKGLSDRIECKYEDVRKPLPYKDEEFDFVYARLVLHYLSKDELRAALKELKRVLKRQGRAFFVVRSSDCPDAKHPEAYYEEESGFTYFPSPSQPGVIRHRYFHTKKSISEYVESVGFSAESISQYDEVLYQGFNRQKKSKHTDNVIEMRAVTGD